MEMIIEADNEQQIFRFMLEQSLKNLFTQHEIGWLYIPDLPGIVIKEDWEHYDELLNWIEEKEKC